MYVFLQWPASHKWTPEYIEEYIHILQGVKYSSSSSFMYSDFDKSLKESDGEVLWDKANLTSREFFDVCAHTHTYTHHENGNGSGNKGGGCVVVGGCYVYIHSFTDFTTTLTHLLTHSLTKQASFISVSFDHSQSR